MPRVQRDRRGGGERPRPNLRQRMSMKHIRMVLDALLERIGQRFRRKKTVQNRRRKQEAKRQIQREIEPEIHQQTDGSQAPTRIAQDDVGCIGRLCGCFPDRLTYPRGRLTVMDADLPPVYSDHNVVNGIIPPLSANGRN